MIVSKLDIELCKINFEINRKFKTVSQQEIMNGIFSSETKVKVVRNPEE